MILIRADANEIVGTGHIMRCLSIARAFIDKGEEVRFVTADHKGDSLLHSRGFETICLNSQYNAMDEEEINIVMKKYRPDIVLVDSYFITESYMYALSKNCLVAYIDDLNTSKWEANFLINYNIFGTVIDYSKYKNSHTKLFLGPQYAPLRDEFKCLVNHRTRTVRDILISAGGSDPECITEKMMLGICPIMKDICFHFIVGALNPRLENIKSLVMPNIVLHINEQNMSGLMQKCDVAISAAGSTLYELCACGTPTITYTLADNQLIAAEEFQNRGLMVNAGDCRNNDIFIDKIVEILRDLIDDKYKRQQMSFCMQLLIDGRGAQRLVDEILG